MKFINLFTIIIVGQIKIYLSNSFIVREHSEYISLMNNKGDKQSYNLKLILPENKLYFDIETNIISQINNLFYYLTNNDNNWKNIISSSRNYFILYIEDINTFHSKISEILIDSKIFLRVKQIIIGSNSSLSENELNIDKYKTDIQIFFNYDKNKIKEIYSSYSNSVFCSTYIYFKYSGDFIADSFVFIATVFIVLFIFFWMFLHYKARKNGKYLFIHSYILALFFFYFLHTILYLILAIKKKYEYFDADIYTGSLYNVFCFFQFFTKLLPALFATVQLNIFELREHLRIIRNSKVIHILSANIFFVISLENENPNLSETLNSLLYVLIIICLFYMFLQIKNCLEEKIIEAMIDEPEYVPTLKYKKNLLFTHCISIVIFIIIYYLLIYLFKNTFSEYRTTKFIIMMINYTDLFLILLLCAIYFPKQLPPQYIEDINLEPDLDLINPENDYFENIYSYTQTDEEKYFENYKSGDMANIVIVENPYNENKIEVEIEEETEEEEEEEEKEQKDEIKEKEKEKEKEKDNTENDKNDIHIETTEEDSVDNSKDNNIINNVEDDEIEKKKTKIVINDINDKNNNIESESDNSHISEEEHHTLVSKDSEIINVLNKSCVEEDILDISHTKLGYIEIP